MQHHAPSEVARTRCAGISAKRLPSTFLNIRFGTSVLEARVACPQIHVQEAVVVEVPEIASHGREHQVQSGFLGVVLEALALHVVEQPVRYSVVRPAYPSP